MARGTDEIADIGLLLGDLLDETVCTERSMGADPLLHDFAATLCSFVTRLPQSGNYICSDERQFVSSEIRMQSLDQLDNDRLNRLRCLCRYASAVAIVLELYLRVRSCNGYLAEYRLRDPTVPIAQEALTSITSFLRRATYDC